MPGPGADASAWRDWYEERAAIRQYDGGLPQPEAEALAFNEAVELWDRLRGAQPIPGMCAGCGQPLYGEALPAGGEAKVHYRPDLACLLAWGRRWRDEAVQGLARFGIKPPPGGQRENL